ncbi:hypothetical protein GCM10009654_18330 [Streptomyces hebeiensis]|uniref:Uncharacterized protein n=1 Tax=Streptomyces hebeiensis TaxID=229486 RepID=A0ABN1UQ93_9ACTN
MFRNAGCRRPRYGVEGAGRPEGGAPHGPGTGLQVSYQPPVPISVRPPSVLPLPL